MNAINDRASIKYQWEKGEDGKKRDGTGMNCKQFIKKCNSNKVYHITKRNTKTKELSVSSFNLNWKTYLYYRLKFLYIKNIK